MIRCAELIGEIRRMSSYLPCEGVPKKRAGVVPNDFLNMEINALGVL